MKHFSKFLLFVSLWWTANLSFAQVRVHFDYGVPTHTWITIGDSVSYGFGNYLNVDGDFSLHPIFPNNGVLVKSSYLTGDKTIQIKNSSPARVYHFCDSLFNSSKQVPTQGIYANERGAKVWGKYKVLHYNCATFVSDVLEMEKTIVPKNLRRKLEGKYVITGKKILVWTAFGLGGMVWGAREAYHADPYIFEKKWGVDPYSFWGSCQWERNYHGGRYLNESGLPNAHKTEVFGNIGRDFWHTSGYVSGAFVLTGTFTIGASKQKLKHKVFDMLIGTGCFFLVSSLTYNSLR